MAVWKILEQTLADFKKEGVAVPTEIVRDLTSARTTMKILKADSTNGENMQKIEEYLTKVESYIVSTGEKSFGRSYVDELLKRREEAGRKVENEEETEGRFVSHLPREHKWIRLAPSKDLPLENLTWLAFESNLLHVIQGGHLVVYGSESALKEFVRKIAMKSKRKNKGEH